MINSDSLFTISFHSGYCTISDKGVSMSVNSKQKGSRGEREWRDKLREYGITARRGQQFSGSPDSPDVVSSLDDEFHWEVKRTEALSLYKAMEQAKKDSGESQKPIIAHKRNGKKWLVVMDADDFLKLVDELILGRV